jgi:hypothetical protein
MNAQGKKKVSGTVWPPVNWRRNPKGLEQFLTKRDWLRVFEVPAPFCEEF